MQALFVFLVASSQCFPVVGALGIRALSGSSTMAYVRVGAVGSTARALPCAAGVLLPFASISSTVFVPFSTAARKGVAAFTLYLAKPLLVECSLTAHTALGTFWLPAAQHWRLSLC
jgi:hypothetical protein